MLGDDSLDSCPQVHIVYRKVMSLLGVSTSLSKCTSSKEGYAEFAKRLFSPKGEVTGLPITLLEEINTKPEQFLELLRICRERGYEDDFLSPGFDLIVSKNKNSKILFDLLSLPEPILGIPPLLEAKPESWSSKLMELSGETQSTLVSLARDYMFWRQIEEMNVPSNSKPKGRRVEVPEYHPILVSLSDKVMSYLEHGEDEYSIYNE